METTLAVVKVGPYRIIDRLGAGGAADVYRARDTRVPLAPMVVVKQLNERAANDPDFVERFLSEIDLCRGFDHPNVIRTLDVGNDHGRYFAVFELIDGSDLESLITKVKQRQGKVPFELALFIIDEALKGLAYAHEAKTATGEVLGLVHRDVSPQNLFVAYDGHVLLGDFGVALLPGLDDRIATPLTMGKLGYLSPEQCFGEPVDRRTDLFAMTIVLAEVVSGQRLFAALPGEDNEAVMRRIGEGPRPNFRQWQPSLPAKFEHLLNKGLAHRPHERFQTCAEFRAALAPYLDTTLGNASALALFMHEAFER